MKKLLLAVLVMAAAMRLGAQTLPYDTVPGDITHTRIYTLANGLKVYLQPNHEQPRIQTVIAVRTGSRNDPPQTTGLAHYLEHLMFKGTTHFGTSNVEKERPLLDSIESRFEQYRHITDPQKRTRWYAVIDSLSQLAAQYNIPNEYDKMMASIGSEGSNAYTGNDETCYVEDIPANEVDNWAKVQADRFENMVIRGFHTELEAVYEEYNIGLSNDVEKMYNAMTAKLFPHHPYGTQTTIGTQEHLKNPSITNIKRYFNQYYVPANIAIIMAGDLDCDNTINTVNRYFGSWQKQTTGHRPEYAPVKPLTEPADTSVVGQQSQQLLMGWQFQGANAEQVDTLQLLNDVLWNGMAGLVDLDLNQPSKIYNAQFELEPKHDYSILMAFAEPKEGQKLDEVKQLLLGEIDKVRRGDFSADLVQAAKNNMKLKFYNSLQDNRARTDRMINAFIGDVSWASEVHRLDRIMRISKADLVKFANRHLLNNYACVYKLQGADSNQKKIDKPHITPIPTNNDKQSEFLKQLVNTKVAPIAPRFLNYSTDLQLKKLGNGHELVYKHNDADSLFNLTVYIPRGQAADSSLVAAGELLSYASSGKLSNTALNSAFYELACRYDVNVEPEATTINLIGLAQSMPKAVKLLAQLLNKHHVDAEYYNELVNQKAKELADAQLDQRSCFNALRNYGRYGSFNPMLSIMSTSEMRKQNPDAVLDKLRELTAHVPSKVLYFGPLSEQQAAQASAPLCQKLNSKQVWPQGSRHFNLQPTHQSQVLMAPFDAKNTYMMLFRAEDKPWTPDSAALQQLFNAYYGSGMNAVVFQELREARGLAYSAGADFNDVARKGQKNSFAAYIITQNDKLPDCLREFRQLIDTIPNRPALFQQARDGLMKKLATTRTTRMDVLYNYVQSQQLGLDYDLNERIYRELPGITLQQLLAYGTRHISSKPYSYFILGDAANLDMNTIRSLGPVKQLTLDQLFKK